VVELGGGIRRGLLIGVSLDEVHPGGCLSGRLSTTRSRFVCNVLMHLMSRKMEAAGGLGGDRLASFEIDSLLWAFMAAILLGIFGLWLGFDLASF
jgi:hypothetical protein